MEDEYFQGTFCNFTLHESSFNLKMSFLQGINICDVHEMEQTRDRTWDLSWKMSALLLSYIIVLFQSTQNKNILTVEGNLAYFLYFNRRLYFLTEWCREALGKELGLSNISTEELYTHLRRYYAGATPKFVEKREREMSTA